MQYHQTLQLQPKEVVLTFDDGPILPMTAKVLEALRAECVSATFFIVGRQARIHPEVVRQIARDGHTIANHSENHYLVTMGEALGIKEFESGFASIGAALAPINVTPAPFIRFPGLFNSAGVEAYAKRKGLAVMSTDFLADDWLPISAEQVLVRAMTRLAQKGSGILLLHDPEVRTAQILPKLLSELRTKGYRIVHLVPAPGTDPEIPPAPLVAEKSAPQPLSRQVMRVRADTKLDATENFAAAETASNYGPRIAAKNVVPVATANGSTNAHAVPFSQWRNVWQERRSAAVAPSARLD
jgi:peptidoglycan/xylan/chitin deacetylase (PgdA/CDA1 family)